MTRSSHLVALGGGGVRAHGCHWQSWLAQPPDRVGGQHVRMDACIGSNPRYTTNEQSTGRSQGLTGTYQLESGRGEDSAQAVGQATRMLPVNHRQASYQRPMSRLNAPKTLAHSTATRTASPWPRPTGSG